MTTELNGILAGIKNGTVVPFLGSGVLSGAVNRATGAPIPADSDSLIIAMNNGNPMAPKLMYEFPRAAMNLELKRGRSFVNNFLTRLYGDTPWTRAPFHDWLAAIKPDYVVDINRDTQLQDSYGDTPHILIQGVARLAYEYRFEIFHYDGSSYCAIKQDETDTALPILFKPMGTPRPTPNFIASDADYVDYITELMGGFAIPAFLKEYRKDKKYLLMGLRLNRDTERMVMADITYREDGQRGWVLIPEPTQKEMRFCERHGLEIIRADINDVMAAGCTGVAKMQTLADASPVGASPARENVLSS